MIRIQYICDNCGEFAPYLPSKSSSITCTKCRHNEKIPEPTKIEVTPNYRETFHSSSVTTAFMSEIIAERKGESFVITKDVVSG